MTRKNSPLGTGAFGPEPQHDPQLGALLRDIVGGTPSASVNWTALADRIGSAVATQRATPWWSYANRWERRAVSMSLVAGIAAALALWITPSATAQAAPTQLTAAEVVTEVVSGAPVDSAASSFARAVTGTSDFNVSAPQ